MIWDQLFCTILCQPLRSLPPSFRWERPPAKLCWPSRAGPGLEAGCSCCPSAAVEAGVRGPSQAVVQAYLGLKLGVWSYNGTVKHWEPVVEPWDVIAQCAANYGSRVGVGLGGVGLGLSGWETEGRGSRNGVGCAPLLALLLATHVRPSWARAERVSRPCAVRYACLPAARRCRAASSRAWR